jgi:8-oxo-dGTP pyrophosphatase MutT (NUDIX family)
MSHLFMIAAVCVLPAVVMMRSHHWRSWALGFEGAGVVGYETDSKRLIVFSEVRKGKAQASFPGGKVEVVDVWHGVKLWRRGVPMAYAIPAATAAREYLEETGTRVDATALQDATSTGAGKTTTGMPVVWFTVAIPDSAEHLDPRTGEFAGVTSHETIDPNDFRGFNRASFPAIRAKVNDRVGRDAIPPLVEKATKTE